MAVSGQRATAATNGTTSGLRKIEFHEEIQLLEPSATPLTTLTMRLNKKPTANPEFKWAEDDIDVRFAAVEGAALAGDTTVNVEAGQGVRFKANDIVKVPRTGETLLVTAVATDALTVTRSWGSTAAAALNDAEELLILGSAKPEGASADDPVSTNPTVVSSYTQIFRRGWAATGTLVHSDYFTRDNDWDHQANKVGIDHKKDIEESFMYSEKNEDTSGSFPRRTTSGVIPSISTNITSSIGGMSETSFFGALRSAFRYGSNTKVGLASGLVVDALNTYPRSKVQVVTQSNDTYGVAVTKYQSPHGTLNLVRHWLLEGSTYGGYMVVLDMSNLAYRYLANAKGSRDTHIRENIQSPDVDGREDEFLTECGLQIMEEKTHALLTGITGAA